MVPRIVIQIEWKFIRELRRSLNDASIRSSWDSGERHRIDSVEAVNRRIKLTSSVVVIRRGNDPFILSSHQGQTNTEGKVY